LTDRRGAGRELGTVTENFKARSVAPRWLPLVRSVPRPETPSAMLAGFHFEAQENQNAT
jgi:hypothetical protein